jgi:hypothetical protein
LSSYPSFFLFILPFLYQVSRTHAFFDVARGDLATADVSVGKKSQRAIDVRFIFPYVY